MARFKNHGNSLYIENQLLSFVLKLYAPLCPFTKGLSLCCKFNTIPQAKRHKNVTKRHKSTYTNPTILEEIFNCNFLLVFQKKEEEEEIFVEIYFFSVKFFFFLFQTMQFFHRLYQQLLTTSFII